jgi:hypothetical protein
MFSRGKRLVQLSLEKGLDLNVLTKVKGVNQDKPMSSGQSISNLDKKQQYIDKNSNSVNEKIDKMPSNSQSDNPDESSLKQIPQLVDENNNSEESEYDDDLYDPDYVPL